MLGFSIVVLDFRGLTIQRRPISSEDVEAAAQRQGKDLTTFLEQAVFRTKQKRRRWRRVSMSVYSIQKNRMYAPQ